MRMLFWALLNATSAPTAEGTPQSPASVEARTADAVLQLERLAEKPWRHPTTGELVRFGLSTIERWYYAARAGSNRC